MLELNPESYPTLFTNPVNIPVHPLYFQDESKSTCLYLAINDSQIDICKMIIQKVDDYTLREIEVVENLTVLEVLQQILKSDGKYHEFERTGFLELKNLVEEKVEKGVSEDRIQRKKMMNINFYKEKVLKH